MFQILSKPKNVSNVSSHFSLKCMMVFAREITKGISFSLLDDKTFSLQWPFILSLQVR